MSRPTINVGTLERWQLIAVTAAWVLSIIGVLRA